MEGDPSALLGMTRREKGARDDKVGSIVRNTGTGPCFGVSLSTNTRASKDAAAYPHGRYF